MCVTIYFLFGHVTMLEFLVGLFSYLLLVSLTSFWFLVLFYFLRKFFPLSPNFLSQ